jgi:hypothetical protein
LIGGLAPVVVIVSCCWEPSPLLQGSGGELGEKALQGGRGWADLQDGVENPWRRSVGAKRCPERPKRNPAHASAPQPSMECHGDLEALLMIEEMVEVIGVLAHIDLHPVHLAIETIAAVISGDAATGLEANIEGFVG